MHQQDDMKMGTALNDLQGYKKFLIDKAIRLGWCLRSRRHSALLSMPAHTCSTDLKIHHAIHTRPASTELRNLAIVTFMILSSFSFNPTERGTGYSVNRRFTESSEGLLKVHRKFTSRTNLPKGHQCNVFGDCADKLVTQMIRPVNSIFTNCDSPVRVNIAQCVLFFQQLLTAVSIKLLLIVTVQWVEVVQINCYWSLCSPFGRIWQTRACADLPSQSVFSWSVYINIPGARSSSKSN